MGGTQSTEQSEPKVVRIDRNEIPEEYKSVGVSTDVVKRVNQTNTGGSASSENVNKLKVELERERAEKAKLLEEMARLSKLQQRNNMEVQNNYAVGNDIEERKKVFNDTVERVQKQFFSYHRENVCERNENDIIKCLNDNQNRVLKCAPLTEAYEKCVGEFRQQVLKGN